jgi:hypothetical protein
MSSPTGVLDGLLGVQQPRISHVPAAVGSAGDEAVDVYALTGGALDPWQQLVLRGAMGERPDGRWAAFEVGLVVCRQNGKDEILCARELWGLFVGGERLIIHSAHKFDTAMEHLERLVSLIDEVPDFRRRVRTVNRAHGREGITLKNGARIRFRARTRGGGGRGYTGDCVIFNEAMDLPDPLIGSIMPVMRARSMLVPGPQIWLAGSAVDQETMPNGLVLARVREAGVRGGNDRLAYFEWSAPDDSDPASRVAWAQANPALGIHISLEHMETEFGSPAMSAHQFKVELLGIGDWPDTSEDAGRVIGREMWAAVAVPEGDPGNRIVGVPTFAIDASPDQGWSSIGVAGRRGDGLFKVAVVAHRRGTDWLAGECAELRREFPRAVFVVDRRGPAGSHIDDLKARKVRVLEATAEDYGRACLGFFAGVAEKRLRYPAPQPELDDALAGAKTAPLGDAWKWSRKGSTSADISPLVAVTLAFFGAEQGKPRARLVRFSDI